MIDFVMQRLNQSLRCQDVEIPKYLKPVISVLGDDPLTKSRLNANSFQHHAITSHNSYQYACLWTPTQDASIRSLTLCRRKLSASSWESFTFKDYNQTTDDGHNIISIGICKGDGTLHLSFDHHCDDLKYRMSKKGLVDTPEKFSWTADNFGDITNTLPGTSDILSNISYPQFVSTDDTLLFSYRVGKAGEGSNVLHHYDPQTSTYTSYGTYLHGKSSNPYINGLTYTNSILHITWTYRHFIAYNDETGTAHKAQAGPNGPENNADLCYAFSDDKGQTWIDNDGKAILVGGIWPSDAVTAIQISKDSGIMNQEAQAVDEEGGVHVLNRDNVGGREEWKHYYRKKDGTWSSNSLPAPYLPTTTGPRGKMFFMSKNLYFVIPSNTDSKLSILRTSASDNYRNWSTVWEADGYDGEPLVDEERLKADGVLSVFTRTLLKSNEDRKVVVLDFDIQN